MVHFPDRLLLGSLYGLSPEYPVWCSQYLSLKNPPFQKLGRAQGVLFVPRDANIFLAVGFAAAQNPSLLLAYGPDFFTGLKFNSVETDNRTVAAISALSGLRAIELGDPDISDEGMRSLCKLHKLQYLRVINADVTDAGLSSLPELQGLNSLQLGGLKITGKALREIGQCRQLRCLALTRTAVTDDGLHYLSGLPLESLCFHASSAITAKGLLQLKLKKLQALEVMSTSVTGKDLPAIRELCSQTPSLKSIHLRDCSFTPAVVEKWRHSLPHFKIEAEQQGPGKSRVRVWITTPGLGRRFQADQDELN